MTSTPADLRADSDRALTALRSVLRRHRQHRHLPDEDCAALNEAIKLIEEVRRAAAAPAPGEKDGVNERVDGMKLHKVDESGTVWSPKCRFRQVFWADGTVRFQQLWSADDPAVLPWSGTRLEWFDIDTVFKPGNPATGGDQ